MRSSDIVLCLAALATSVTPVVAGDAAPPIQVGFPPGQCLTVTLPEGVVVEIPAGMPVDLGDGLTLTNIPGQPAEAGSCAMPLGEGQVTIDFPPAGGAPGLTVTPPGSGTPEGPTVTIPQPPVQLASAAAGDCAALGLPANAVVDFPPGGNATVEIPGQPPVDLAGASAPLRVSFPNGGRIRVGRTEGGLVVRVARTIRALPGVVERSPRKRGGRRAD